MGEEWDRRGQQQNEPCATTSIGPVIDHDKTINSDNAERRKREEETIRYRKRGVQEQERRNIIKHRAPKKKEKSRPKAGTPNNINMKRYPIK
jgi:hypothetical protein